MKRSVISVVVIMALSLFLFQALSEKAEAKEQEIIYAMAAPFHPEEGGETMGLAIYLEALQGRIMYHPDLRGKFTLKIVDKGTLVPNQEEALTATKSGGIQMTYSNSRFLEQLAPEWKLLGIPGLVANFDHLERVLQTPVWKELHERTAKQNNVRVVKWLFNIADLLIFTDKGPVEKMEDLKGQKIRFPGSEAYSKLLKAMGATGVSLPYTEVVTALQTHMVDGVMTEISGALEFYKLPRYTKYCINYPLAMDLVCWVVNNQWWESLDPKARKAINDVFERIDVQKWYVAYMDNKMKEWASDPKLKMLELSKEEKERWAKTIKGVGLELAAGIDPKYIAAIDSTR
jgi:TRAP-type C4-dicarboxylate transport system substrate-binding protein